MAQLFDLSHKVAIVTGGASGIGRAIVEVLAKQGAIVHFIDIDSVKANEFIELSEQKNDSIFFHNCDLTNHRQVEKVFDQVVQQSGSLDILVNNAGVACIGSVSNTTIDDMDRLYQTNVRSVYSCLHFGVHHMKLSGGGSIVNLASVASVLGLQDRFAYSMSKGAVYTMTFSIAKDFIADNIRCNAVGPGRIHTPFVDNFLAEHFEGKEKEMFDKLSKTQPIGRMGKPKEVAHLVAYLCSEEASFITGSFYPIDGGFIKLNTGS